MISPVAVVISLAAWSSCADVTCTRGYAGAPGTGGRRAARIALAKLDPHVADEVMKLL